MLDFNGFAESGAFSGLDPAQFFISHNPRIESRLDQLDGATRDEVKNHLREFHSEEEMERFIDHLTIGIKILHDSKSCPPYNI
ncbi:hypothetical protein I5677_06705 [Mobilitalea sibirica]|uniref:Uncharacterized protein n=1 Tax=Mobilitalea sibirica TaxID=1462919 RepID=A0A8J7H1X5_9FIRM|nr:hypothetical protein [Mobilitalea sibirica]MBH1940573.1 hypothetical protein [Mobilitalea sibirica]